MGEQRKKNANRHGARGLRKLREARTRKPTNFVPEDVDRARERTTLSRRRNEDGTFPQRRTIGERRRRREERKEGRSRWRGRKVRARETSLSACHRDRFNEKNVRSRPEIDSRGEVAYIPPVAPLSSSVSSSRGPPFVALVRGRCRRRRRLLPLSSHLHRPL